MKLCVLIPMFNEEAIAAESVTTILTYVRELPGEARLVIVNDGSRDRTETIVREIRDQGNQDVLDIVSHETNQGYGAALRTGIRHAQALQAEYVLFMDSDLTNHPRYLKDFYAKMEEGWDYIKATRYSRGGGVEGVPLGKRILSRAGNRLARVLFGLPISDYTNGFRAVKMNILKDIRLTENGFVVIMEELYRAKYLTRSFCEIPYVLTSREKGQGRTHFSYGLKACRQYLKYAVKSFIRRR